MHVPPKFQLNQRVKAPFLILNLHTDWGHLSYLLRALCTPYCYVPREGILFPCHLVRRNAMDIFRNESERALGKQIFQNTPLQYELLEISSRVSTETHLSRGLLQTAKLRRGTLEWADAESTSPSLILVKVDFEAAAQQKLYTTANDILLLFRCLELDTCMLYMMYRDIMGFHQVSFRQSIRSPNETVFNFFVNIEPLKVLWSFNATNLATKGIVLTRATPGGRSCYHDFCRLLDQYSRLMAYPLFPAFAVVLEVVAFSDKIVNEQEEVVAQTELKTGFSPWSLDVRYNFTRLADLDKLSFISQKMGATLVELESVMWYMKTMQRIITSFQGHGSQDWSAYASEAGKAFIHSAHQDISQVLSLIRPQSEYTELYIGYLRERAKNQLSVVSVQSNNNGMVVY